MESSSIDDLIGEYRSFAAAHNEPNDGSPTWVVRVNGAADHMVVIARRIAAAGPDAVTRFAGLLRENDPATSLWVARHLLDFMNPEAAVRDEALGMIERAGETRWLENWQAELQDE